MGRPKIASEKLCNVVVHSAIVISALQVLSFYQALNAFLDKLRGWIESDGKLLCHFRNELVVVQGFARFHDSHDRSFIFKDPIEDGEIQITTIYNSEQ